MRRLTLGKARTQLYRYVDNGLCPTDQAVADAINEAQERLIVKGKWHNAQARYDLCCYDGCITLPREFDAIEAVAVDCYTKRIYSEWYEFVDSGIGLQWNYSGLSGPMDRGRVVTFRDICGTKQIRIYCDLNEDADAEILIRGLDGYGNKVMTLYNGSYIEGEYVSLAPTYPQVTTSYFTSIDSVVKPVTKGVVRLYQYDPSTGSMSAIAMYAPGEELPIYRRYVVPNLSLNCTDSSCSVNTTDPSIISCLVKRRHIPAVSDNDDLTITNVSALKRMLISMKAEMDGESDKSKRYEMLAEESLKAEQHSHRGGNLTRMVAVNDVSPVVNVQ